MKELKRRIVIEVSLCQCIGRSATKCGDRSGGIIERCAALIQMLIDRLHLPNAVFPLADVFLCRIRRH